MASFSGLGWATTALYCELRDRWTPQLTLNGPSHTFVGSPAVGWSRMALAGTQGLSSSRLAWADSHSNGKISNENVEWSLGSEVAFRPHFEQVEGLIQTCVRDKICLLGRANAKTFCKCHGRREGWQFRPIVNYSNMEALTASRWEIRVMSVRVVPVQVMEVTDSWTR